MGLYSVPVQKVNVIKEEYFGTVPEIVVAQKALSNLRKKYVTSKNFSFPRNVNVNKDLLEFNRAIADAFGFKSFQLMIIDYSMGNACTVPVSTHFDKWTDPRDAVIKTPNGYKFKKDLEYSSITMINSSIIFNSAFTDREVMAIILHEIGHSFSAAFNNGVSILDTIKKILSLLAALNLEPITLTLGSSTGSDIVNKASNNLYKHPTIASGIDFCNRLFGIMKSTYGELNTIIMLLGAPFIGISAFISNILRLVMPPTLLIYFVSRNDETLADLFPTMYGYGPEIASSLQKMEIDRKASGSVSKMIDKVPLLRAFRNLYAEPFLMLTSVGDEHPTVATRTINAVSALKYEVKKSKDLTPEMRDELNKNIKEIEGLIDKNIKNKGSKTESYIQFRVLKHIYNISDSTANNGKVRSLVDKLETRVK